MKKILDLYKYITNKNFSTLAGSISFFFIVNGGSVLFLCLLFLNFFNLDIPSINFEFTPQIDMVINNIYLTSLDVAKQYSFFFIITSIWTSSSLFYHMIKVGEMIYDAKREKFRVMVRIFSIFLVFLFIIIIICSVIIFIIISYMNNYISFRFVYVVVQIALTIFVPLIIILFLNLFIPPINIGFNNALRGSFLTLLFWIVSTIGFSIYINIFADFKEIYGTITFLIVFMIWIYILIQGLIIGMILNQKKWVNM